MADTGGTKKIDILLITFQRLPLLKIAVRAIKRRTKYPYRLIIIDNGSTDDTKKWLKNDVADKVIFMEKNVGLSRAYQEGLKHVQSEYFICAVDDTIPPKMEPCWLEQELGIAKANPEYGGIAMKGVRITDFNQLDDDLV